MYLFLKTSTIRGINETIQTSSRKQNEIDEKHKFESFKMLLLAQNYCFLFLNESNCCFSSKIESFRRKKNILRLNFYVNFCVIFGTFLNLEQPKIAFLFNPFSKICGMVKGKIFVCLSA